MALTKNQINSILIGLPDIRALLRTSFRKLTALCPFEIVRGVTNSSEAGYQPMGGFLKLGISQTWTSIRRVWSNNSRVGR